MREFYLRQAEQAARKAVELLEMNATGAAREKLREAHEAIEKAYKS